MYRHIRLLILIIPLTLLFSCASQFLSYAGLNECNFGEDITHFSEDGKPGDFNVKFENVYKVDDMPGIEVIVYETHLYESEHSLLVLFGRSNLVTTYTALTFEDGKLIFWGYPEDYLKSDDGKIRKIGKNISDIIFEKYL